MAQTTAEFDARLADVFRARAALETEHREIAAYSTVPEQRHVPARQAWCAWRREAEAGYPT